MESWRARKGVLASRGEVDGPRVEECNAALSFFRLRGYLIRDFGMTIERADALIDQMLADGQAGGAVIAAQRPTDREGGSIEAAALAQTPPSAAVAAQAPSAGSRARSDGREA